MPIPALDDLLSLDRDVARAAQALAAGSSLDRWRHVAGQSTYDALATLRPSALDAPLRDGLRRWVVALVQGRLAQPLDDERAAVEAEASAHLALPEPRLVTWRDAWRGVVASATPVERSAWLDAAAERGPAVADVARRRAERRHEIARRLGLDHEAAPFAPSRAPLEAAAEALLARTDDLASHLLRDARARQGLAADPPLPGDTLAIAVGRDAPEGWPSHLSQRWLESTFGSYMHGLRLAPPSVPEPLGAASFARACASFGASLRVAGASPSLPFALARDPWFVARHRFACVFGALPASRAFQRRALGNVARIADAQARVLARTLLVAARVDAMRFLLGDPARPVARDRFEELASRVLGAPLPAPLAGAWPAARDDEPARLVALVTSFDLVRDLVDRYDEDWFANPRAPLHLRALASGPAREEPPADLAPAVDRLARAFEEALG